MKKYIFKIISGVFLIVDVILFFPDMILYISWKNETDLYRYLPFLQRKSFLGMEDCADNASVIVFEWYWLAYIIFFAILLLSVTDAFKSRTKASIVYGISMLAVSFIIMYIVYRHHSMIEFIYSPANDLPWDLREIVL